MNCSIPLKRIFGISVIACSLFFFASCDPNNGYYQFYDVPNQGWSWDDSVVFVLSTEGKDEAIQPNDLNISVRIIDGQYAYQNIVLLFSGDVEKDTLKMPLQDSKGQWLGKCNAGVCEITMKLTSLNPALYDEDTLVVQQWSRDASLQGVLSLGLFTSK
jgi:gliding motility-associated lipoprotein GldH